jgi:hypothetical protein
MHIIDIIDKDIENIEYFDAMMGDPDWNWAPRVEKKETEQEKSVRILKEKIDRINREIH